MHCGAEMWSLLHSGALPREHLHGGAELGVATGIGKEDHT